MRVAVGVRARARARAEARAKARDGDRNADWGGVLPTTSQSIVGLAR